MRAVTNHLPFIESPLESLIQEEENRWLAEEERITDEPIRQVMKREQEREMQELRPEVVLLQGQGFSLAGTEIYSRSHEQTEGSLLSSRTASVEHCWQMTQEFLDQHSRLQKLLQEKIVQMQQETQALMGWKEDRLQASMRKIEQAAALLENHEIQKQANLQVLLELREQEAAQMQQTIVEGRQQKAELQQEISRLRSQLL